jgi:uracil-DNA glycosylase family 4
VTHPRPETSEGLALQALADFWADMGLEEARALRTWRPPRAAAGSTAPAVRPPSAPRMPDDPPPLQPAGQRGAPRKINNNPINDARRLAAQAQSLAELRAIVEQFDGCPLKKAAKTTVVCDGAFDADIMIVGEAPGGEEDARGLPFVGRAGQLLDRMLATVGLTRQTNVYITNLIYWRPPGNRDPSPAEMQMCAPFLLRQIELKQPKLLLTAGKFATHAMLNKEDGIMKLRGRKLSYAQDGMAPITCIPMLHPAYLLRNPADKAKAWDDLRAVANFCDELGIKRGPSL